MISKEHKKHSDIARPSLGNFGRNEIAIVGTTCDNVKALSAVVIKALSTKYKCAYIDADHTDKNATVQTQEAFIEYTDKISYKEFRYKKRNR
jgi:molybdopterin-guanine dinucleotide biosynthesis protein A